MRHGLPCRPVIACKIPIEITKTSARNKARTKAHTGRSVCQSSIETILTVHMTTTKCEIEMIPPMETNTYGGQ